MNIKTSHHYPEFLEATKAINKIGDPVIQFPLNVFKEEWLNRFLDESDEKVRYDWARNVTASPYVKTVLVDEKGNAAIVVPSMLASKGDFIAHDIPLAEFLSHYNFAKNHANGNRAIKMMETLAEEGVTKSSLNVNDLREWVAFYDFFNKSPKWLAGAKEILEKIDVQNNSNTNDTVSTVSGDANDFGTADDFEPL